MVYASWSALFVELFNNESCAVNDNLVLDL